MYKALENSKHDLRLGLEGAYIDVGHDIEDALEEFGNCFKCWMILLVHFKPVNPNDETQKGCDRSIKMGRPATRSVQSPLQLWRSQSYF